MHKKYIGKKKGLEFSTKRLKGPEPNPNNQILLQIPGGGSIEIKGTGDFVTTIFRQLLEHPETLIGDEIVTGYNELSPAQQKRFRKQFKMGEFADPESEAWPAWLENKEGIDR